MHIGLSTILTEYSIDVVDLAPRVEELGFDSIWTSEQPTLPVVTETPVPREWGDIPDPFLLLSRAAVVTTTLKLGTAVCVVTERHPITLAKEVATLDMYSGGRFLFGIGTGSHREEAEIFGSGLRPQVDAGPRGHCGDEGAVDAGRERVSRGVLRLSARVLLPETEAEATPAHPAGQAMYPRCSGASSTTPTGGCPSTSLPNAPRKHGVGSTAWPRRQGETPSSIEITAFGVPADRQVISEYARAGVDRVVVGLQTANRSDSLAELERIASSVL